MAGWRGWLGSFRQLRLSNGGGKFAKDLGKGGGLTAGVISCSSAVGLRIQPPQAARGAQRFVDIR
jgi:hypothetical protein